MVFILEYQKKCFVCFIADLLREHNSLLFFITLLNMRLQCFADLAPMQKNKINSLDLGDRNGPHQLELLQAAESFPFLVRCGSTLH
jgi:hypothetical protein